MSSDPFPDVAATAFATPIGRCGIAWGPDGIRAVHLPEATPAAMRALLRADTEGVVVAEHEAPDTVREAIDRVVGVLSGADDDLRSVRLDLGPISPFAQKIYDTVRTIGPGQTATYGEVAHLAGFAPSGAARAVGRAMGANPCPIIVPCHRVTAANGRLGGYSASGGTALKVRILLAEARGEATASPPDYDVVRAIAELSGADPKLAALIESVGPGGPRRRPIGTTVSALAEAIVSQQLNGRAAAAIFARVCALFPKPLDGPTPTGLLALPDDVLRGAGLSGSKLAALRDLAERSLAGEIPELVELAAMSDDEVVAALTHVRGIGRWTVEMLLIFRLGRPNVLPVDDFGVRAGLARIDGRTKVTAKELAVRGEAWQPWRSVASWYLWRAADMA
jgi:methylated-DNA-[protein]-cysteine S-methyltransferase